MIFYVKSGSDRDALLYVFKRVYGWVPEVRTLSVEHRRLQESVEEIQEENDFVVILLGKEDCRWLEPLQTPTKKTICFWKSRIRNGRVRDLVELIERAKMGFVYDVEWDGVYKFGGGGGIINRKEPGGDVYFIPKEWKYRELLSELTGKDVGTPLVQTLRGTDILFAGKDVLAVVPRNGGKISVHDSEPILLEKEELVKVNRDSLEKKVATTLARIRGVLSDREEVVVPVSGGKDSSVVALLLKEAGISFVPIFVDTGGEFEETLRYIDTLEKYVGKIERIEAPVKENFERFGKGYLLRRECTRDKIGTLYAYVRKNFDDPVLVNGDRVAESRARSFRPEVRRDEFLVFSPINLWSYFNEQLFLWSRGIPMNRLYEIGFYRVGCSFCPFVDRLEMVAFRRYTV